MDEPTEIQGDDLMERLKTTRNRAEIALILIDVNRRDLTYTILEDLHLGTQMIIDMYCIKSL